MQTIPFTVSHPGVRPVPVAIYSRVSTVDRVGARFASCETQEELARQHITRNAYKHYYLRDVFCDHAYAGSSKRPRSARIRAVKKPHSGPKPSGSASRKMGGNQ